MKTVKFILIIHPEEIRHEKTVFYSIDKSCNDMSIDRDCFSWVKSIMNWNYEITSYNGKTGILGYPYRAKLTVNILGGVYHEKIIEIPIEMESECIEFAENFMDWYVEDVINTD